MAYYEQISKNSYKLIVSTGYDSKGKKLRKRKTIKLDESLTPKQIEKELNRQLVLFEKEVTNGTYLEGEKTTFEEFTKMWFKDYAEINLTPGTLISYKTKLDKRILPAIGHIKLSKLQPHHLVEFYNNLNEDNIRLDSKYTPTKSLQRYFHLYMISQIKKSKMVSFKTGQRLKAGKSTDYGTAKRICKARNVSLNKVFICKRNKKLSQKTIRNHIGVICSILSTAMKWNIIMHNPAMRVDLKKAPKSKAKYYDDEQIFKMFEALKNEPLRYSAMVYLAVDLGLRKGELTGLKWEDIDFKKSTADINKQRHYVMGYGTIESATKTEAGARVVTVSQTVLNILKDYKRQQAKDRLRFGTAWQNSPYVFLNEDGSAISTNLPYRWFVNFLERHNLPRITFHQLRHTNASLLIASGEDIVTVSGRLGHTDKNITLNTYSHVIKSKEAQAANRMDEFYAGLKVNY